MPRIPTKDSTGKPNGWLQPLWNIHDGPPIAQVYALGIEPKGVKGPHLHLKRRGLFTCLAGEVLLVIRPKPRQYCSFRLDVWPEPVKVPAGVPAAIYNVGFEEALVLNMPEPAWRPDDQDEWPVEGWDFVI